MQKLIFIYNAKSGLVADVKGAMTKILNPGSYDCDLCKITYGVVTIKDDWRVYLASLPHAKVFLHKDELVGQNEKYSKYDLPVLLLESDDKLLELVTKKDFEGIRTVQDLVQMIDKKLLK
jgi:hypothetical protein